MTKTDQLIDFLKVATSPIQSVASVAKALDKAGFTELSMGDPWRVAAGQGYYIKPYATSIFAFKVGADDYTQQGFRIVTSHTDTPGFKVKPNPEIQTKAYLKINTEVYPSPMFYSWLDRPLSLAGHVVLKSDNVFEPKVVLVDFPYPLMTIPSLAIHFNRDVNNGWKINPQKDMLPIIKMVEDTFEKENYVKSLLAEKVDVNEEDILDYDLYVYVQEEGAYIGPDRDLVSAPRVDNQASVFASIQSLIDAEPKNGIAIAACFDSEEVGSVTRQGADSSLLLQIVERISFALNRDKEQLYRMWHKSFMISSDGAHAAHPNAMEKNDESNFPVLNGGITIKFSAKQSYSTDGVTAGIVKQLCDKAGIKHQVLVNRSDMPGGKTLGPIATKYIPIRAVDLGIPMLAMHSAKELFGTKDYEDSVNLFTTFFIL